MRQVLLDGAFGLRRRALSVLEIDDGRQGRRDGPSVAANETWHGQPAGTAIGSGRAG